MKVGLIGDGGREHAIAKALKRGNTALNLVSVLKNRNQGIIALSDAYLCNGFAEKDELLSFFKAHQVDFVVIGPEAPLMNGIVDYLRENGIPVVGANQAQARLEGDKAFMRNLLHEKLGWGSPNWKTVTTLAQAEDFLVQNAEIVVKPIGLTGGKGVRVMGIQLKTVAETYAYIQQILDESGVVLLEEKLIGEEFSRMVFVSEQQIIALPLAQDFKYGYDGDQGLMTGGMGSYTCADHKMPFVTDADIAQADQLLKEVIQAIVTESGADYRGFLYGQFMLTQNGIRLIEFNVRLGDPEAINMMGLSDCNIAAALSHIANGEPQKVTMNFAKVASVVKYLVPQEYPQPLKCELIFNFDESALKDLGLDLIQASVERLDDCEWKALGSRTLGVIGFGKTPGEVSERIETLLKTCEPQSLRHRADVGNAEIIAAKCKKMQDLKNA